MSHRTIASNLFKVVLLIVIVSGVSKTIQLLCLIGIAISLAVDFTLYKREQAQMGEDPAEADRHVPLPPDRLRGR